MVTNKLLYSNDLEDLKAVLTAMIALTETLEIFTEEYLGVKREARKLRLRRLQYQARLKQIEASNAKPEDLQDDHYCYTTSPTVLIRANLSWPDLPVLKRRKPSKLKGIAGDASKTAPPETKGKEYTRLSLSEAIRDNTRFYNWYRLLIVRLKRLLDVINNLPHHVEGYRHFVQQMNWIANPIFAHLAYAYYAPIFASEVFFAAKHIIPGFWMGEKEASLGTYRRTLLQLDKRWFNWGNDGVWLTVGLVNCFVLVGVLSPVAAYLTVGLYAFDVAMAAVRAAIELGRILRLRRQYQRDLRLATTDEERQYLTSMLHHLDKQGLYQFLRMSISLANTTGLLLGMCLTIPALAAINPIIPLVGVSIVLLVMITQFILSWQLEKRLRPDNGIKSRDFSFFKVPAEPAGSRPRTGSIPRSRTEGDHLGDFAVKSVLT